MAVSKASALLVLTLLLFHLTDAYQVSTGAPSPGPGPVSPSAPVIDCSAACAYRCSKTKRPNLCKRACGSCCSRCKCVPPGTYGNYEACPCYYNLTTPKKIRKCP